MQLVPDLRRPANKEEERLLFALVDAVEAESIDRVRAALAAGADVSLHLKSGDTALGKAARRDSLPVVGLLLDVANDVVKDYRWFDTAIVAGASRRPCSIGPQLVEMMLKAGADPSAVGLNCTALQAAVYAHNVDTARMLLDAGAAVDAVAPGFNVTPLALAMGMCGRLYDDDFVEASLEMTELLARAGADAAYVPDRGGWASAEQGFLTPYQYAMSKSRFDIVRALTVLSGQDPLQTSADGKPMWALIGTSSPKKREAAREFILSLASEVSVSQAVGGGSSVTREPKLDCCL